MNLPIVDVPEYFLFISTFASTALGFLISLTPFCFIGKRALLSIPIFFIPIIGMILIIPESILNIAINEYVSGLIIGLIIFYIFYKKSIAIGR